jgi:hypothetical protein
MPWKSAGALAEKEDRDRRSEHRDQMEERAERLAPIELTPRLKKR